jgi:acyl-CoA synthetase (AMP-forming)/AMP-acid ligase II
MQDRPLLIASLLNYAARYHGTREIVSRTCEGPVHRYTYAKAARRSAQAAHALKRMGVQQGDRIATLGWNTYRHFELFYAVSGMGAVLHTVNPRLFEDQIRYIIDHGGARIIFVDGDFLPLIVALKPSLPNLETIICLSRPESEEFAKGTLDYEVLIANESDVFAWPEFDERCASALCYTSGTTGDPKGVLYSHRSTVLHAMGASQMSAMGIGCLDSIIAIAPFYHACAWGMPYIAALTGAKLVLPGPRHDPPNIVDLIDNEQVTFACGVPTVWTMVLQYLRDTAQGLGSLNRTTIGGSAVSPAMIAALGAYDVRVLHLWGMTEMSPVGTVGTPTSNILELPEDSQRAQLAKQGRAQFGVDLKIVDDLGNPLAHDGVQSGALWVRGPWIASGYYRREQEALCDVDGWFPTGDVATIDQLGYMQITDRAKDIIKSGGEWISSIDLESIASGHPKVALVAVIGIPHPKWEERPLMIVECVSGSQIEGHELLEWLRPRVAKWTLPEAVLVIDKMPLTATGKIRKTELRSYYGDGLRRDS